MKDSTPNFKKFLIDVISNDGAHGRWLNTLSFMEYLGCRKIVKSQHSLGLSYKILEHIHEEAGHALLFKKWAMSLNPKTYSYTTKSTIGLEASEEYFQNLDRYIESFKMSSLLNYCYVTYLVEMRATWAYQIYSQVIAASAHQFSFKGLLKEEDQHLKEMTQWLEANDPNFSKNKIKHLNFENEQYKILIKHYQNEIQAQTPQPLSP